MEMLSKHPDLIDYRGNVTDESGYAYKDINALELALKLPERIDLALSIYETVYEKYGLPDQKARAAGRELFDETLRSGFREHVAKGNQDAAEAMLEKHPKLLTCHGPVTDYSSRTFIDCTAYEYAYWAKDTYMCRMLEKKCMAETETVKAEMLDRIKTMERIDEATQQKVGLRYTQHGKEHHSAHFDLTPLKDALKHYLDEYNKTLNKSKADWDALGKIWIEEVGRAQRDVPAHIAQEYCHPDRTFKDIADITKGKALLDASNPANLKRSLKFGKWVTNKDNDSCFYPGCYAVDSGLGFSFGILRGATPFAAVPAVAWACYGGPLDDLVAVKALDEERTKDLKQSLENLSQPPVVPSPQSPGI